MSVKENERLNITGSATIYRITILLVVLHSNEYLNLFGGMNGKDR